jgi:hypothetical protein
MIFKFFVNIFYAGFKGLTDSFLWLMVVVFFTKKWLFCDSGTA